MLLTLCTVYSDCSTQCAACCQAYEGYIRNTAARAAIRCRRSGTRKRRARTEQIGHGYVTPERLSVVGLLLLFWC